MGFRTVSITKRCKLETRLNYLVVRSEKETKILLDEISTVIISNTQVSMTAAALSEMINHNIKVIFCDDCWNPQSELVPYASNYQTSANLMKQIGWTNRQKDLLWKVIIEQKLSSEVRVLRLVGHSEQAKVIQGYAAEVDLGDTTNREGLAAKFYFENLFGLGFNRRNEKDERNAFLNYGYSILLSAVNREIASDGFSMQLGVHHIGSTNPFNLGCDFMEPLRAIVDLRVVKGEINEDNFKKEFNQMLSQQVYMSGKNCFLDNAIRQYVLSLFTALAMSDMSQVKTIKFAQDEQL